MTCKPIVTRRNNPHGFAGWADEAVDPGARSPARFVDPSVFALNPTVPSIDPWKDEQEAPSAPPLTRAEVQGLLLRKPQVSVWRVVALQAAVGMVVALGTWIVSSGNWPVVLSALYGAAIIAVPSALFALSKTNKS